MKYLCQATNPNQNANDIPCNPCQRNLKIEESIASSTSPDTMKAP